MKKTVSVFLCFMLMLICALPMAACSLFGPPSPNIYSYGNVVAWDELKGAASYRIYADGEQIAETEENFYVLSELKKDAIVTVTSVTDRESESRASNRVTIQRSAGFTESETLSVDLNQGGNEYFVGPEIRYVKISGESSSAGVTIRESRTDDLYIELDHVSMTSGNRNNCIRTENNILDAKELKFTVIFILKGPNVLTGASQTEVPAPQTQANSGRKGTNGADGRSAIVLPTAVMTGSGSLQLKGGNGGEGGIGAPSSGWSTSLYGDGGNGGTGGGGLKCTTLVLALEKGARVSASGGIGGKGGRPGDNGSIVSGPVGTVAGELHFGKTGADGKGLVGELVTISGSFMG